MADSGYVYLVTHENSKGLSKIGLTRNPEQRTAQLGGDDCSVLAMVMCINPEHVEALLHRRFAANRLPQSEWFDLKREELEEVCDVLLTAHEEATQFVVLPNLPPEPEPEPEPVTAATPKKVAKPIHAPFDGWREYRYDEWEEVTAFNTSSRRKVRYIPGRGYCAYKGP